MKRSRVILTALIAAILCVLGVLLPSGAHAALRGMMLSTLQTPQGIVQNVDFLAARGANIVRFPVYFSYIPSVDDWLNKADTVLAECERQGVTLVIDFHHPTPGIYSSDIMNPDDFVDRWQMFATRFKSRGLLWYDLCNEPTSRVTSWSALALRTAKAIRAIDTKHAIVYEPGGTTTSSAINATALAGISHQILEFHFYDWIDVQAHPYTPNGDYSSVPYPSTNRTRDQLRALIARVRDAGVRNQVPVYIGEVAISRQHPNAGNFLRDFTNDCDDMGINCTVHCFREADIWNYELYPGAWNVLTSWFAR